MAYSITFIRTIAAANETIATFDQQGTFLKDRQKEVELLHHYVSMDEWQSYMAVEAQFYEKPDDRLLDAIGFSRGRFTLDQQGAAPLVIPPYAEVERVTQDCRGG